MSEIDRTPRDLETRSSFERPKAWAVPDLLPSPNPEPGWEFRWVRIAYLDKADGMNISSKLREGWEPVKASEHPEILSVPSGEKPRFNDSIEIGGLVLCKIPEEFTRQRAAHYGKVVQNQVDSVDNNFMRENDPRMPLYKERKSTVSFGRNP